MAKIIELLGSPGVGKTTLYREMESLWNKDCNWMPSWHFYPKKEITTARLSSFFFDVLKRIKNKNGEIDAYAMEEAGRRFIELYPDYIEACWNNINRMQKNNPDKADLRFHKASYIYKVIKKIQAIREKTSHKIAVADEGLINIINSIFHEREVLTEEKEEINRLLELMPIPDGVVYVETGLQENFKRLTERKKVIPVHQSLEDGELKKIIRLDYDKRTVINNIIESKNIPSLTINSSELIAVNVSKIISFAENLYKKEMYV